MCAIGLAVQGVMMVASAAMQYQQAETQAKAANEAAEAQWQAETDRAKRESMDRENQLQMEANQESSRFAQQREQLAMEALREHAAAKVAGAESGVGGVTAVRSFLANEIGLSAAEGDINQSEGFTAFNIQQRNRGITGALNDRNENAALTHNQNTRARPSALGLGIEVGAIAAGQYAKHKPEKE